MKRALFLLIHAPVLFFLLLPSSSFSTRKISSPFTFEPQWEASTSFEASDVDEVFSQPFTYLGCGAQCYAFLSADGNYVLKFFKTKHLIPKTWLNVIPLPQCLEGFRFKKVDKRQKQKEEAFASCLVAFEELRKETALVEVHLNKTEHLHKKIVLVDKSGKKHCLNLDGFEWVLQQRAELIYERLLRLQSKGEKLALDAAIGSVLQLVDKRCRLGLADRDKGVRCNFGFVGERAVQIDVCGFFVDEKMREDACRAQEVERIRAKIQEVICSSQVPLQSGKSARDDFALARP